MANAQIIGGAHQGSFLWDVVNMVRLGPYKGINGEILNGNIESVQVIGEDQQKSFTGTLGAAAIGSVVAGPLGAITGAAIGGNSKSLTFYCILKDGREFLAKGDSRIFELLFSATLSSTQSVESQMISLLAANNLLGIVFAGDLPEGAVLRAKAFSVNGSTAELSTDGTNYEPLPASGTTVKVIEKNKARSTCIENGWDATGIEQIIAHSNDCQFIMLCKLADGRKFLAIGEGAIYDAIRTKSKLEEFANYIIGIICMIIILGIGYSWLLNR